MANKMVRPIMTVEARDALDRMTANYELRSDGIVELEKTIKHQESNIKTKSIIIHQQESSTRYYMRESHQHKESRNYWLKVAGVSIVINWAFLIYTAIEQGWLL